MSIFVASITTGTDQPFPPNAEAELGSRIRTHAGFRVITECVAPLGAAKDAPNNVIHVYCEEVLSDSQIKLVEAVIWGFVGGYRLALSSVASTTGSI